METRSLCRYLVWFRSVIEGPLHTASPPRSLRDVADSFGWLRRCAA